MAYYISNGDAVTLDQIKRAFESRQAVLVHGRKQNSGTSTCLSLDGVERDTRGECYSMSEEVWTTRPKTLGECLRYAYAQRFGLT